MILIISRRFGKFLKACDCSTYSKVSSKLSKKSFPPEKNVVVKTMTKNDLIMVRNWAIEEGWNPGRHEIEVIYAADPNGYYLLKVDGDPIACLAGVKYSPDFAFLGNYIVRPNFRGQGYGKFLWDAVMEKLSEHQTIGLNGVLNQVENYQKEGFRSAFLITRWFGKPSNFLLNETLSIKNFRLTNEIALIDLIDYDTQIFSTPREAFLSKWITMPDSHFLAAVENNKLKGYGVISSCFDGFKIAPLFADNEEIAKQLFAAFCQLKQKKDTSIFLDAFEHPKANSLIKYFGFSKLFDTQRMYKGPFPSTDINRMYASALMELG